MSHRKAERPFSFGSPIDFWCHFTNDSTEKKTYRGTKRQQNYRAIQKYRTREQYINTEV